MKITVDLQAFTYTDAIDLIKGLMMARGVGRSALPSAVSPSPGEDVEALLSRWAQQPEEDVLLIDCFGQSEKPMKLSEAIRHTSNVADASEIWTLEKDQKWHYGSREFRPTSDLPGLAR